MTDNENWEVDQVVTPDAAPQAQAEAVVSDEVVGEIEDENGETLEVHLVKPDENVRRAPESDFPLGKYGKFGERSGDARVVYQGSEVERILSALGMGGDTFTPEVTDQVRQVQGENNLPQTGLVDKATWDAITRA